MAMPEQWFELADELFQSVIILYKNRKSRIIEHKRYNKESIFKPIVSKGYLLLAGYTVENLLKSILIIQTPSLVQNGKIDSEISTKHNLFELSKRVKCLELCEIENQFLKVLSEGIPYWSRYPVPKKWQQLKAEVIMTDQLHETFLNLYDKLRRKIYFDTRFGWEGPEGIRSHEWFCSEYEHEFPIEKFMKKPIDEIYRIRREKYLKDKQDEM